MILECYAKKLGMTSLFSEVNSSIPVTVLCLEDMVVVDHRLEKKHGYNALVVSFCDAKDKHLSKPQKSFFKNKQLSFKKMIKEIKGNFSCNFSVGDIVYPELKVGNLLNVTAFSKGKGFQGAMKRHNFGGLRASHGVSVSHRSHGSTGGRQDPGKVFKNKKMAGHLGQEQVTVKNLEILRLDKDAKLLYIKGSVPGSNNSFVKLKVA